MCVCACVYGSDGRVAQVAAVAYMGEQRAVGGNGGMCVRSPMRWRHNGDDDRVKETQKRTESSPPLFKGVPKFTRTRVRVCVFVCVWGTV